MTRVLFLVSGLGLGNSTRCHAVIQHLKDRDATIFVATSGNGLWYFSERPEVDHVFELESLYYGKRQDRLSIGATLGSIVDFVGIQRRNGARVERILSETGCDVVVNDSVYVTRPMKRRGIPLVALNNSDVVVRAYRMFQDHPSSIRAQFYAVELMDYLFHRWRPDVVVSPTLASELGRTRGHFRSVGGIVRKEYGRTPYRARPENAVIMLSGSTFGTRIVLDRAECPVHIDVLGRDAPVDWTPLKSVNYRGRVRDPLTYLKNADVAVVNGGFSAVSEMYCMAKPMVVVPVPGHAEQWLNGRTIEYLGIGLVAGEDEIQKKLLTALERLPELQAAYARRRLHDHGASEAAAIILDAARGRTGH